MSQETLASAAGVSQPTVRRMESRGQTTVENLVQLLRQLDLLDGLHTLLPAPGMDSPGKPRQCAARRRHELGVHVFCREDRYAEKLLANADRWLIARR